MAGNVTGLHVFQNDVSPEPLSNLDTNYSALQTAINTLNTYSNFLVDTGTVNNLNVTTPASQYVSYGDGLQLLVRVGNTTTGAATLNVNNMGPVAIKRSAGGTLLPNDLFAGQVVEFVYDTPDNAFVVPSLGGGGQQTFYTPFTVLDTANQTVFSVLDGAAAQAQYSGVVNISPGSATDPARMLVINGMPDFDVLAISAGTNTTPNHWAAAIHGSGNAGCSNGVFVQAGTNANDLTFMVGPQAGGVQWFVVRGDGSGVLGPAPNQLVWDSAGHFSLTGSATLPGGGGGGSLASLSDVAISAQANGQVLTWNAPTARWVNLALPAANITTPLTLSAPPTAANTLFVYGAPNNAAIYAQGSTTSGVSRGLGISAGTTSADFAMDVHNASGNLEYFIIRGDGSGVIGPPPNQLVWDANGQFSLTGTAALPARALSQLSDVSVAGQLNGQVLTWSTSLSKWINATATGGGGSGSPFTAPFAVNDLSVRPLFSVANDGSGALGPVGHQMTWDLNGVFQFPPTAGGHTSVVVNSAPNPGGITLAVSGGVNTIANQWTCQIGGNGPGVTAGCSNGLLVVGGTTSADNALLIQSNDRTRTLMQIKGDGSGLLGASANNMTWTASGFTFTSTTAGTAPITMVSPPATTPNLWMWQIGGGGPSGASVGCSNGLRVAAGTNINDNAFVLRNDADNTTFMQVRGDGSGLLSKMAWSTTGVFTFGPSTDPNGVALVARGAPHTVRNLWKFQIGGGASGDATDCSNGLYVGAGTSANDVAFWVQNDAGNSDYLKVAGNGAVFLSAVGTTATAANAVLDSTNSNNVLRSTSAARYKRDVRTMARERARETVRQLRAVSYRSRCEADDPQRTHYGLIAEEVAAIDPNLVTLDGTGQPAGVQYERIAMLLLPLVQELLEREPA